MNESRRLCKIIITWSDGSKTKFKSRLYVEGLRKQLTDHMSDVILSLGDTPYEFFSLKHARSVEIIDD